MIAEFLSIEEVEDIKEMFKKMDTDNDGIVSIEELKSGLRNFGSQLAESEVQMLIEAVSMFFLYICPPISSPYHHIKKYVLKFTVAHRRSHYFPVKEDIFSETLDIGS